MGEGDVPSRFGSRLATQKGAQPPKPQIPSRRARGVSSPHTFRRRPALSVRGALFTAASQPPGPRGRRTPPLAHLSGGRFCTNNDPSPTHRRTHGLNDLRYSDRRPAAPDGASHRPRRVHRGLCAHPAWCDARHRHQLPAPLVGHASLDHRPAAERLLPKPSRSTSSRYSPAAAATARARSGCRRRYLRSRRQGDAHGSAARRTYCAKAATPTCRPAPNGRSATKAKTDVRFHWVRKAL